MTAHLEERTLVAEALRHDLPLIVLACQRLPCGGLPQAGLLADHCWVVADALECLLWWDEDHYGHDALLDERGALRTHLARVTDRVHRLYSADRPGGFDRLDWHLACLRLAADQYLSACDGLDSSGAETAEPQAAAAGEPSRQSLAPIRWPAGYGHRSRARVVAWAAVALNERPSHISRSEPLATREWLHLGAARRARRRAETLWGSSPAVRRPRSGLGTRAVCLVAALAAIAGVTGCAGSPVKKTFHTVEHAKLTVSASTDAVAACSTLFPDGTISHFLGYQGSAGVALDTATTRLLAPSGPSGPWGLLCGFTDRDNREIGYQVCITQAVEDGPSGLVKANGVNVSGISTGVTPVDERHLVPLFGGATGRVTFA